MENNKFYANRFQLSVSMYDVYFKLINATPVFNEKGEVVADNNDNFTEVFMSPQHAKVLSLLLAQHLSSYEKQFGEINIQLPTAQK